MLRRSFFILTSALTLNSVFIHTDVAQAQCYTNDLQCWLDYSEQVLDYSNQMLQQMESQWEEGMNRCLQGDLSVCRQIQLNNQSWQRQQPNRQRIYEMKKQSLQDTACLPYCN